MASLHEYGFAAVVDHPLDDDRVARIYGEWLAFFSSGEASGFRMDPVKQDGYFSLEEAEHAKGFVERDFKEYFQFYPWGRCPESLQADLASHFAAAVESGCRVTQLHCQKFAQAVTAELTEPLRDMIQGSEQSMLRVLHYPPVPTGRSVLRAAPHEDINSTHLVARRGRPWARAATAQWRVDFRAAFSRPTDRQHRRYVAGSDGWLSAFHLAPRGHTDTEQPAVSRMSLPLFLHPRPDVVLSSRYTARQYLMQRLDELGVA